MFHVAETVHNTIEACSHLVTRIPDIRIRFVTQITKTSFGCETIVKNFSTNTSNIFCNSTDFLSYSSGSIRDIFIDTCFCFLNGRLYILNVSLVSLILSHTETAAAPKPPPTNAPPTAPQPEPQPELRLPQQQPSLQPLSAITTPSPAPFYFYSHNVLDLEINNKINYLL